jgi:uncharacterized protein CbrC (UPF0167 family)
MSKIELPPLPPDRYARTGDIKDKNWLLAADVRARDRQIVEVCAARIEQLRDEHCAATQQAERLNDHCYADGSSGCEYVAAWNDAIAAIRNLIEEINNG